MMAFEEPLKGRREMRVTERRRKSEFAETMRYPSQMISTQRPSESAWW
jgi:hypothetical protein